MRRVLRALSTVLIVAGTLLIADAAVTLAWQEPVSAIYAKVTQDRLSGELGDLESKDLSASQRRALATLRTNTRRIAFLARADRRSLQEGDAVGRIKIPKIGANFVIVEGSNPADLRTGPGHYPETPLPGLPGTVAIAGHRTTYLAPFRRINELKRGDRITITMPYGTFVYSVQRQQIVSPQALWVLRRKGYNRLVLTACHPLYSAAQRIVVFAREISGVPRGAAKGP